MSLKLLITHLFNIITQLIKIKMTVKSEDNNQQKLTLKNVRFSNVTNKNQKINYSNFKLQLNECG